MEIFSWKLIEQVGGCFCSGCYWCSLSAAALFGVFEVEEHTGCRVCSSQFLLPGCNLGIMETLTHELSPGTASPVTNVPAELCQARQNGFVYLVRRFVPRDEIWDLQVTRRQTLTCLFLVLPAYL